MGNSICYGGQRGISERDENPPVSAELPADSSAETGHAPTLDAPQAPAGNQPTGQPETDGSFGETTSEEAAALNMALALTRTSPSVAPASAADGTSPSASQNDLIITTIHMLPAPAFEQQNMVLQTPEEMMEDVQILRIIGSGAFAVVYRGVYQGGDAAIKVATIDLNKSGWSEAFVASQLRHPHVVNTYAARGARLTREFLDRAWRAPAPQSRPPRPAVPPQDALPALSSEDGLGNPRKATHERQGWRDVLSRVGASPDKGLLMLVQELCDKGNLANVIKLGLFRAADKSPREHTIARRMLLRTAAEICRGMMHLHKASVVHGDLKPANVLLQTSNADRRGFVIKIADFGLARMLQKDTSHVQSETTGTVPYMSPETFNGVHSKASDVYAFGMVLWEMMTGQQPYKGVTVGQIIRGVIDKDRPLRPSWPDAEWPALCALGRRCLDGMPSKRPTFKELEGHLVALEEGLRETSQGGSLEGQHESGQLPPTPTLQTAVEQSEAGPSAQSAAAATAGGGSGPSPLASPVVRHRLALAVTAVGGSGAGGADSGGGGGDTGPCSGGDAAPGGGGGGSCVASPGKRGSLELRRQAAAAEASAAAAAASLAAAPTDGAVAAVAAAASVACTISEPISPWSTALADQGAVVLDTSRGTGI